MTFNDFAAPASPDELAALDCPFYRYGQMAEEIDITLAPVNELDEEQCNALIEWMAAQRAARRITSRKADAVQGERAASDEQHQAERGSIANAQRPQPNIDQISEHLYVLFDPAFVNSYPHACVEIAYSHPRSGNLDEAKVFTAFELKEAVEFAAMKNAAGYNVYVGPSLRTYGPREVPPDRRAKVENYLASAFAWVDFDGADDAARVQALLPQHGLKPALVVTTGTVPHLRGQLLFRVSDIKDAEHQKQINEALQKLLGTDPQVVSAVQPMRLAGTVNYPTVKKATERGYVVELTKLRKIADAPIYRAEQLIALAPAEESDPFADHAEREGVKQGKSDDELVSLLKQSRATPGKGWREPMLKFVGSAVGKGWSDLQIKLACAPYSDGGIDDPDIEKLIDDTRKKFGKPEWADCTPAE
jgi:RepB DNA-primase from phage plasmid